MSPENRATKSQSLRLKDLIFSQDGLPCLSEKGRLVLKLIRISNILSDARNSRIPFAISPQYRSQLVARRSEIGNDLGINPQDERKLKRLSARIQQETGLTPHQIFF
jgi:hypothetical protein